MLCLLHESVKCGTQRGNPRETVSLGKGNPGCMDWDKDRCLVAGFGGPAAGKGNRFVRAKPYDFRSLDSWSEPRGNPSSNTEAPSGSPDSVNTRREATVGAAFGKETPRIRPAQSCLGWANTGDTPKAAFWTEAESSASPEVAAPIRLQPEAGQLCLSSGPRRRFPQFSKGVKKNCAILNPDRPLFFRMRLALVFIPAWGGAGPRGANDFGFPPIASTTIGSICLVGWRHCWGGRG